MDGWIVECRLPVRVPNNLATGIRALGVRGLRGGGSVTGLAHQKKAEQSGIGRNVVDPGGGSSGRVVCLSGRLSQARKKGIRGRALG